MNNLHLPDERNPGNRSNLLVELEKNYSSERLNYPEPNPIMHIENGAESGLWSIRRFFEQTVQAMQRMMDARDPYTAGHQERVSYICIDIAQAMGVPAQRIKGLQLAALIHDIGKLAVPSEILSKPGQLNAAELDMIKTHPSVGFAILKDVEFPWPVAHLILQHHERMDGSGYPQGLSGKDILFEARILSVADVIEAMSANRPYRASLGMEQAIEEICKHKYSLYDADVVDACLRLYSANGLISRALKRNP